MGHPVCPEEADCTGLDKVELGMEAYPDFFQGRASFLQNIEKIGHVAVLRPGFFLLPLWRPDYGGQSRVQRPSAWLREGPPDWHEPATQDKFPSLDPARRFRFAPHSAPFKENHARCAVRKINRCALCLFGANAPARATRFWRRSGLRIVPIPPSQSARSALVGPALFAPPARHGRAGKAKVLAMSVSPAIAPITPAVLCNPGKPTSRHPDAVRR